MLSCLPKVFNTVLLLFQSAKCSVITKQELLHKIVSSQCDIVDQSKSSSIERERDQLSHFINVPGEVEEQLGLLLELVPDWISGKTASTGDFLFWYALSPQGPIVLENSAVDFLDCRAVSTRPAIRTPSGGNSQKPSEDSDRFSSM